MTDRRDGRGRLSSIDLLPEDAEVDIVWALEQLRLREMPQTDILKEFNRRLAERGLDPIKKSAFNSWSMRKAVQFRRIDETRTITRDIVASIGTGGSEEMTIAVAELVKVTIYELLESREKPDAKALAEMSRALQAVTNAQRTSTAHRDALEARAQAQVEAVMDKVDQVAAEQGLSADRVAQIRRDVLGVRTG